MALSRGVQEGAFARAIMDLKLTKADGAAVALGRRLAKLIDEERKQEGESQIVVRLSAQYLAVLVQLGMTPAARAQPKTTPTKEEPKSLLQQHRDELAARRAKKQTS